MGVEEWDADIIVTDDLVQNVIEKQFSELCPVKVRCVGEGWDNKVFLVNDKFIFRFPHRKVATSLIGRENAILDYLQDIVNLKIPNPLFIGVPSDNYPHDFHGYEILAGKSACHADLSEHDRLKSIPKLAEFLRRLHSISEAQARTIGAQEQVCDYTDTDKAVNSLSKRVNKINNGNYASINLLAFDEEMKMAKSVKLPTVKVLVHGDLDCRHLMFDDGMLEGVIDWGDVGINNQSVDLSVVYSFYPEEYHASFFEIYGEVDAQTLRYARFVGLYGAITVLLYSHNLEDERLAEEAADSIRRINPSLLLD